MTEMSPDTQVAPGTVSSAGALLQQMREAAGVHIAAVAASLKVPVEKLEALKANRHEAFSDVVFMRGLASSVCRHLRVDATPVLALLPGGTPTPLPQQRSLNATYKDSQPKPQPSSTGKALEPRSSKVLGLTVLLILVATLGVALYPTVPETQDSSSIAASAESPASQSQPQLDTQWTATATAAAPSTNAAPADVPASVRPDTPAQPAGLSADTGLTDVLVLKAIGQAWVQIRDAGGQMQQKTLQAGESLAAAGTGPWKVVVGNVQGTEVLVRGQPMDLSYVGKSNVARFEVQ